MNCVRYRIKLIVVCQVLQLEDLDLAELLAVAHHLGCGGGKHHMYRDIRVAPLRQLALETRELVLAGGFQETYLVPV